MEKHLVVIELDNAILKNGREITIFSRKVLKEVVKQGHKVVFTTGWPYVSVMEEHHRLLGFSSVLLASDGRSVHFIDGTSILNYTNNYKYFENVFNEDMSLLKAAIWAIDDDLYVYKQDENLKQIVDSFGGNIIKVDKIHIDLKLNQAVSSVFCVPYQRKADNFYLNMYGTEESVDTDYEESSIKMILKSSCISENNLIVFSGTEKGLNIAKYAKHSYIMKNSSERVKEMSPNAIETELTCDEDGVARELVKYFSLSV